MTVDQIYQAAVYFDITVNDLYYSDKEKKKIAVLSDSSYDPIIAQQTLNIRLMSDSFEKPFAFVLTPVVLFVIITFMTYFLLQSSPYWILVILTGIGLSNISFKNTGQKTIERFTITTNITRNTALIDVRGLEYYMSQGFMNIYSNGKRRIKSGETFHILINYTKVDHVLTSSFSPEFALLFEDDKQRIWYQNMRIINGNLTPTDRMDMVRFQEMIRQDGLFSAYKNPMLW
ncbi:MAG: hypothetical protein KKH92_06145 [Firmicutes bacterium]|nr:hypothetical protein [Bacillota bacterium]